MARANQWHTAVFAELNLRISLSRLRRDIFFTALKQAIEISHFNDFPGREAIDMVIIFDRPVKFPDKPKQN